MKKLILLATMFATMLSVSAQRNIQVWEDGSYSEFPTTNVDSVTFLLSPNGTPRTYVTPQFKIESDYWYVSYDEGWTWTQLGKATGEQGAQGPQGEKGDTGEKGEKGDTGAQGPKGDKGDSMFLSVTQDDNYIYLLMTDSTKIQIAKANKSSNDFDKTVIDNLVNSLTISKNTILLRTIGQKDTIVSTTAPFSDSKVVWTSSDESIVSVVDGKIEALQEGYVTITACAATLSQQCKVYVVLERDRGFSVSDTSQVLFSPGNLQYNTAQKIWRFAEHPYEIQGMYNTIRTTLVDNWIDLFSLGCNGYKYDPCESGRVYYQPRSDLGNMDIEIQELSKTDYDFGWYNKISNGGNQTHLWRMFTYDEMEYLLTKRTNANKLVLYSTYNEVSGILILPDGFEKPTIMNSLSVIDDTTWQILSAYGAVFLPQAGSYQFRNNSFGTGSYSFTGVSCSSTYGTNYWCSSFKNYSCPSFLHFDEEHIKMAYPDEGYRLIYNHYPNYGFAVRLVKDL